MEPTVFPEQRLIPGVIAAADEQGSAAAIQCRAKPCRMHRTVGLGCGEAPAALHRGGGEGAEPRAGGDVEGGGESAADHVETAGIVERFEVMKGRDEEDRAPGAVGVGVDAYGGAERNREAQLRLEVLKGFRPAALEGVGDVAAQAARLTVDGQEQAVAVRLKDILMEKIQHHHSVVVAVAKSTAGAGEAPSTVQCLKDVAIGACVQCRGRGCREWAARRRGER